MAITSRPNTIADDTVTVIGESVQIKGTLSGDEDLHVLGRVDGRVELQRTLVVGASGIVKAEVSVRNAVISGVVVGNVHATESIEITKEGRMVGDVFAPRVIIVDGASFRGNVDMGDIANMPARAPDSARPKPAVVPPRPAPPSFAARSQPSSPPRPATLSTPPTSASPSSSAPEKPASDHAQEKDKGEGAAKAAEPPPSESRPTPLEPPAAKGLPHKSNKTRVIVKRK